MPDEQSQSLGIQSLGSLCLSLKQHGQNKHLLNSWEYFRNTCHASLTERTASQRRQSFVWTLDSCPLFCGRLRCFIQYSTTLFPVYFLVLGNALEPGVCPHLHWAPQEHCHATPLYSCTVTGLFSLQTFFREYLLLMPSIWRIMRIWTSPSGNHL